MDDAEAAERIEVGVDRFLARAEGAAEAGDVQLLRGAMRELVDLAARLGATRTATPGRSG